MKQISTLFLLIILFFAGNAFAQNCTWTTSNYDMVVISSTTIAPTTASYTQGFVCNGATLTDSATCCTRLIVVDNGATLIVGPQSYGMAYVLDGGTFNGQGASGNWIVTHEPMANILNHTGPAQQCSTIVYSPTSCSMGIADNAWMKPTVTLNDQTLIFSFTDAMQDAQIELLDVNGKVVKSEMINQSSTLSMDVAGLAAGVYMYRVMQGGEVISSDKLVISE